MSIYNHILLATDFSEHSKITAIHAREVCKQNNARLSLIHVVETLPAYASGYLGVSDLEQELMDTANEEMTKLGNELNVPKKDQIVILGSPKHEVVLKSEELDVDLIIVGSHSKQGIAKLLGSTAVGILHRAHCDVLTVKE